jgi:NADH:ubiquinone oxidoreductase subunit 6 (subunit J)
MLNLILINILSISIVIASMLLLFESNRVYSVLYLIFIYMCSSILFMFMGIGLIGAFYFLVYIGAVSVLFLFSVMILDLKDSIYERDYTYMFPFLLLFFIFSLQFFIFIYDEKLNIYGNYENYEYYIHPNEFLRILGIIIFCKYNITLLVCGLILLISMIGSIYLTNVRKGLLTKKQKYPMARAPLINHVSIY